MGFKISQCKLCNATAYPKVSHNTQEEAAKSAIRMTRKNRKRADSGNSYKEVKEYQCEHCNKWHISGMIIGR